MPDTDRSAEMLRLVVSATDDYYTKHGHYPYKVRVGPMVARYLLKPGEREAQIALRPGGTTIWITVVLASGMSPTAVVVES